MRRALWIVAGLATAAVLYVAASLVLPILIAALLALLLAPLVTRLTALRVPQHIGAAIVVVLAVAVVAGMAAALAAPVERWINAGPQELRRLENKVAVLLRPVLAVKQATERVTAITQNDGAPGATQKPREVTVERSNVGTYLNLTVTGLITVLATTVLVYFLLASGDLFLRKTVRILPRLRDKIRAIDIAREIQVEIGRYFGAVTLVAIGLGISTAIAMWLLDMPTPVLWGVIVGALNFVPYLGPLISTVLLAAVALVTFDTPLQIIAPPAVYLALNFVEDQLVMPVVLGRRLVMNPVMIFVWVLVCTWMWGMAGIVLAVPLLVAVRICTEHLPVLAPVAELLARD